MITYTQGPRTTADSIFEKRIKDNVSHKAKRNIITKSLNKVIKVKKKKKGK
jgi:hypothetical protein